MSTGWNCLRVCHLCNSVGWHDPTEQSTWFQQGLFAGPSPFKVGEPSPFLSIPGCNHAKYMTLDFCHCFHLGYGMDMAASTIVLLAQLNFYQRRSMDDKLHMAFSHFIAWCKENKRVTSIRGFSKQDFDMASTLDRIHICFIHFLLKSLDSETHSPMVHP